VTYSISRQNVKSLRGLDHAVQPAGQRGLSDDHRCPYCHQRMLERHGARLSPKCADIFDMIEHAGERGVAPEILRDVFFANRPHKAAYAGLKTFIWQINEFLASTDLHIGMRHNREGIYRVERWRS
jgi:hypothetical protein